MSSRILVTGANGYIASRLIPRLLDKGFRVRALARRPERLVGRAWLSSVEVMQSDVTRPVHLASALEGVHTAYYLVHSMASGRGYTRFETEGARLFASAAEASAVQHIIYLGGLADESSHHIAPHMRSRIETGRTLRQGPVPVTEFRAGVIVGPGSISFEMIRFLTECFPLLPGPNWLHNQVQPIAASNVIDYLVTALELPEARGGIYEIGGPDVMLYSDTMLRYAKMRNLKRLLVTVPGIPIWLMARFVDWLTPVPFDIASPLIGGLQSDSIVVDDSARRFFSAIQLIPYQMAVSHALGDLIPSRLERVWEGVGRSTVHIKHEGFFVDFRRIEIRASKEDVYNICSIMGGENGWPYANWLWRLRGWIDRRISRRSLNKQNEGRFISSSSAPNGSNRNVGDVVDYYRVEAIRSDSYIRLHSTLTAPGEGWMEWRVEPYTSQDGGNAGGTSALLSQEVEYTVLMQTAFFAPRGLPGFLYWYLLAPLHRFVFRGLVRAIKQRSEIQRVNP